MLYYALLSFAAAAVVGLVLAASVLRDKLPSWTLSLVHGALGAVGLVLTLFAVFQGAGGAVQAALIVLVIAALGGFFLASSHLRNKPGPKPVVVVHALAAVTGVLVLAGATFQLI